MKQRRWQYGRNTTARCGAFNFTNDILDGDAAPARPDVCIPLKILHFNRAARRIAVERAGAAGHGDTASAGVDLERPIAVGDLNAAARSVAVQRSVQSRET